MSPKVWYKRAIFDHTRQQAGRVRHQPRLQHVPFNFIRPLHTQVVTPGLDPGVHRIKWFIEEDGLHRNSGLPELRTIECRKSGKPDLRCQAR